MSGSVPVYCAILEVELSHSMAYAACSVCLVSVLRERPSLSVRHVELLGTALGCCLAA